MSCGFPVPIGNTLTPSAGLAYMNMSISCVCEPRLSTSWQQAHQLKWSSNSHAFSDWKTPRLCCGCLIWRVSGQSPMSAVFPQDNLSWRIGTSCLPDKTIKEGLWEQSKARLMYLQRVTIVSIQTHLACRQSCWAIQCRHLTIGIPHILMQH